VPVRVFVAADVGALFFALLEGDRRFEVVYRETREEGGLVEGVRAADILVTRHHNRVSRAVIAAGENLKLIAQGTSGLDNIDLEAATDRGIAVLGLPGENANAVAELVIGHIISLTRSVPEYGEMLRIGVWQREDCASRRELASHVLGIVGLGRVGRRVAGLAATFGMIVLAYDPYLSDDEVRERGAERRHRLEDLLKESTVLTLHVPLTAETRNMIAGAQYDQLPPNSVVINTSRGPVIDQRELFARLDAGSIAGAALDVFDEEPPAVEHWPERGRLILTPHIAGCTLEARESIGRLLYEKICDFIAAGRS
jgi:D-3-phosphoglycerate dehydrogenase / 2-oxoglutarate reductase